MPPGRMRALVVGDNTSSPNWGGRAASLALYQTLAARFEVTGTITGSTFLLPPTGWPLPGRDFLHPNASFGFVHTLLPGRFNWLFLNLRANRHRRRLFDYYVRLEELYGARDFVAHDPAETAENVLRYRRKLPGLQDIYEKVLNCDVVVVNGEGDVVFATPPERPTLFLLGMAELGLRLNKKVVFVNSIISDSVPSGRNQQTLEFARRTLSRCTAVAARDYESCEYVTKEMPGIECAMIPDSLFSWYALIAANRDAVPRNGDFILPFPENKENLGRLDFSKPYICIGGSALAARDRTKSIEAFTRLVRAVRTLGHPVYLIESCAGDSFLQAVAASERVGIVPVYTSVFMGGAILANARLLISGRYHPSILAALGGTPSIFLGSVAHKMHSLQTLLEYEHVREFPVHASPAELEEIVSLSREYLGAGDALRRKIEGVARKLGDDAMQLTALISDRASASEDSVHAAYG